METKKQLIVITGGAGGIGTACAKVFKKEHLIITDYSQEMVDKAVRDLKQDGFNVSGIACDITDKTDIENLKQFVADNGSFKALIHTAGVSGTVKDLKKIYAIDLVATELLIDAFYDLATENSVAVLLSSMMGYVIAPNEKYDEALQNPQASGSFETISQFIDGNSDTLYNFAKRGVHLLVQKHVNKWGEKGARIVSISPGVIETPMGLKAAEEHPEQMEMIKKATPLKRNGQPEDIADVVEFLISDKARFITGTDILVDGGVIQNIKKM
ncbi:MAG: SDR family oxidoreductase [Ginsengibacter sp.]|jgi:NAD(P)-dependent dehydrogenase (short-subunit alcohol dehydrogenase family)